MILWHNPRCSKSRAALALLQGSGASFALRHYLVDPPDIDELRALQLRLGRPVIEMMRRAEPAFRDLGLTADTDPQQLLLAMASTPQLIERPVLIAGQRAVIGRPPERVLDLLAPSGR